jgi:hypothetical protein
MRHSIIFTHRSWLVLLALAALALTTLACGFEGGAFGSTPTPSSAGGLSVLSVGRSAPSRTALDMSQGPMEAILITAPPPGQGARGSLQIEGLSDPAIAQQLNVLVRDAQGTVIAAVRPAVQPRSGERSTFSVDVFLPPNVPRQTGLAQVYASSPGNNGVTHLASVEVDLGGDAKAAAPIDAQAREEILIGSPRPDEAVNDVVTVAAATRLGPKIVIEVRDANNQIIGRVEQTVEQTKGAPAQILAEVPIQVSTAGPGRVLVYAVNALNGSTEHLNSVAVNLVP